MGIVIGDRDIGNRKRGGRHEMRGNARSERRSPDERYTRARTVNKLLSLQLDDSDL